MVEGGSLQPSGRVIAGGRLLLGCLFLLAIWSDSSQPARLPVETYFVLVVYVGWALAVTLATWRNWWLDARLAVAAHVIDIAVFMAMLFSTEGYTSPYFTFFVFLLLSAAIRWGWRETAATAAVVVISYFATGLAIAPAIEFDTERFIVRTGHLLILSAILIWFGANQRIAWPHHSERLRRPEVGDGEPLESALRAGMHSLGAVSSGILWQSTRSNETIWTWFDGDRIERSQLPTADIKPSPPVPMLYDFPRKRALSWAPSGRWKFFKRESPLPVDLEVLGEGLAVPITSRIGNGYAFFQGVPNLSTDHLEIGFKVGAEIAGQLQAVAALSAAEERSMAKARVAVARDLHDSVVQFLAGIGFRIEALSRLLRAGSNAGPGLAELKQLVIGEQEQLRAFIGALRTGGSITNQEVERDISTLCERLANQWDVHCRCQAELEGAFVPVRLHLDVIHLIGEAVANAVRHGEAKRIEVKIAIEGDRLAVTIANDGSGMKAGKTPVSLASRVADAGGELTVRCEDGHTILMIRLPASGVQ